MFGGSRKPLRANDAILPPMRTPQYAIALLCVTLGCLFPQQNPDDPNGWTKAKWGMSKDEIIKAFPDATEFYNHLTGRAIGLRHFEIGSQKLTVMFVFGDEPASGLKSIAFEPEGPYPELASSELLARLKDKYGQPIESATDNRTLDGKVHLWEWTIDTTDIKLSFGDFRNPEYDFCTLQYRKIEKQDVL